MRFTSCRWLLFIVMLAACQSVPPEPGMKIGKPYVVDGSLYYPEYEPGYDKTGEASWYGPGFHGKYTASGEIFNQNDLTAAHPTLPMPSLVRVTNLSNGKSLIVRVNDRGPFKSHRIIDLSKASAQKLGIRSIAQVRVQFLKQETTEYLASLQQGGKRVIDMAQYNKDADTGAKEIIQSNDSPSQIVENTDASSHAGQIVDDAAPVMTVSAAELENPASHGRPPRSGGLIKSAWADDEVPVSAAEKDDTPRFDPPAAHVLRIPQSQEKLSSAHYQSVAAEAYIIQAGSFSTEENARKLASRLAGMASLTVDKTDMGEKPWWRVRLGPFKNKESADNALAKVHAAGVPDAKIVHLL